jgi:hypothetical protein
MRYATPELVEVGTALSTVLGGIANLKVDNLAVVGDPNYTGTEAFELN